MCMTLVSSDNHFHHLASLWYSLSRKGDNGHLMEKGKKIHYDQKKRGTCQTLALLFKKLYVEISTELSEFVTSIL